MVPERRMITGLGKQMLKVSGEEVKMGLSTMIPLPLATFNQMDMSRISGAKFFLSYILVLSFKNCTEI